MREKITAEKKKTMIEAAGSHVNEQVRTFSQIVTLVLRPVNSST